jgi:hypothetical protein
LLYSRLAAVWPVLAPQPRTNTPWPLVQPLSTVTVSFIRPHSFRHCTLSSIAHRSASIGETCEASSLIPSPSGLLRLFVCAVAARSASSCVDDSLLLCSSARLRRTSVDAAVLTHLCTVCLSQLAPLSPFDCLYLVGHQCLCCPLRDSMRRPALTTFSKFVRVRLPRLAHVPLPGQSRHCACL